MKILVPVKRVVDYNVKVRVKSDGTGVETAQRVCAECPVQAPCRESGRRNHESGIWGGETEEDRVRAGFPIRTVTRAGMSAARGAVAPPPQPAASKPEVA